MPAPVALSPAVHASNKSAGTKSRAPPPSRKTRIVRRRGRAKDALESDDEIEREVGTDSETDDDDESSVDSASDSDTEPASEDVLPNGHARILTPSLNQSSADMVVVAQTPSKSEMTVATDQPAFFGGAHNNWSEMVADENDNGPADLPVIDFADFDGRPDQRPSRKAQKGTKRPSVAQKTLAHVSAPSPPPSSKDNLDEVVDGEEQIASSSRQPPVTFPKRAPGQTARQAYQQRLEKDPSYVPTVGEFWGHDDRLLDKDLRSLSGWWRVRWQGGRGGFNRGFTRGRGRGRFLGPQQPHGAPNQDMPEGQEETSPPPIERAWTHDGFEEMRRKEESRRPVQHPPSVRGAGGFRGGRGAFTASPRAGGGSRGGFIPSPMRPHSALPFTPVQGRTWFAMKPERMWTKQHDGFLHFDPALKPRAGQGQGIQVKLPGATGRVIRAPIVPVRALKSPAAKASTSSVLGSDDGEKKFVVRLPKSASREQQQQQKEQVAVAEPSTTAEELPVDDAFTVRPRHVTRPTIPDFKTAATAPIVSSVPRSEPSQSADIPSPQPVDMTAQAAQTQPEPVTLHSIRVDEQGWIQAEAPASYPQEQQTDNLEVPPAGDGRLPPPVLPPIQTSFTPVPQPSPTYGSPYGYPPGLPPGVAMNQQGVPYEVSTGRAIYYQPPQQVYNPRPIMHTHMAPPGIPFVPGHMRHMTTSSPDFMAPPHTPPVNGFIDPSTGTPMFSMPRQSSRIEIRSPSQSDSKGVQKTVRRPSGLRTTATAFEPQQSTGNNGQGQSYFQNVTTSQNNGLYVPLNGVGGGRLGEDAVQHQQQTMDPAVMGYPPYQQQYYYPEQYGYPSYMEMSQVGQYELYPPDPHATSQQPIYY